MNFAFPTSPLRQQEKEGKKWVWDLIRKKWVVCTPEEFVRQQLIHYLTQQKNVPASSIGVERAISYNDMSKRFDLIVFSKGSPHVLCECKSPMVALSEDTLHQISRYNVSIQAPHLLITNGLHLMFFSWQPRGEYVYQSKGWYD